VAGKLSLAAQDALTEPLAAATCVACGPGLGRSRDLDQLVSWLYTSLPIPVVLDADALNGLAARPAGLSRPGGPRVLTPHPGEFRRLSGCNDLTVEQSRQRAQQLAAAHGIVIVLKGHGTLITDGRRNIPNQTGNPGMATGGSGDVLTGIITALICQSLPPWEAAWCGAHVHGLAGDLAAAALGEVSLIASDLIAYLPAAFEQLRRQPPGEGQPDS
jgi:NAD(P)H-hydrate epimerase